MRGISGSMSNQKKDNSKSVGRPKSAFAYWHDRKLSGSLVIKPVIIGGKRVPQRVK